ncbi:MAG: RDD family protein [Caldilinea sp.]|nr:RDD family protein [Caldilinea sp.]MCB9114745.1 RDD family protein [Caldilineaceae bacterium]MCB9120393.1 RDD family protein [Caldilineaceae bacterium]MCB9140656.1 RDD family protein [Anaerolineales bacterium]
MSAQCPQCGATNQPSARFCNQCSTALTQSCPSCRQSHPITARFCNSCGASLTGLLSPAGASQGAQMTGLLTPNAQIGGRYLVVRRLGQGGMGAVYLVSDQRLAGKQYALKEMSDQAIADPVERQAALEAFQQEAAMLAALNHANLPQVTDYFTDGGNQYLVMEFVQGQTLEKKLEVTRGPLPEPIVRRYAEQLCDVLVYLHGQHPPIIFRDLKPANIMVLPGDKQIKLIDFGIARHFKPGKRKDTQAMGTPGYAAPEQYGKGQSDARTDIYAFGATLHHAITGRDPSTEPFKFPSVRSYNSIASASFEQIVGRAVMLDPGDRWQSARDLQNALFGQSAGAAPTLVTSLPATMPVYAPRVATQAALPPAQLPAPSAPPVRQPPPLMIPAPYAPQFMSMPPGLVGSTFASYGKRVGAFVIDTVLCYVLIMILVGIAAAFVAGGSSYGGGTFLLAALAASWLYFLWPTARSGQTLGKKMVKIKVVDENGYAPGWGRSFMRYVIGFGLENLLMYIMIGLLGWLWPLWDANKQAWHDKIGGTFVVDG